MSARLFSFVTWALAAAGIAMWASRLLVQPAPVPAHAETVGPAAVPAAPLVRLFGAAPAPEPVRAAEAPPVPQTQFRLIGVVAPGPGQRNGLALIAADDRPPRAVPLGGRVDESMVVLTISHRLVEIGPKGGPPAVSLNLPAVPEAARGVPPSAVIRPGAGPMPGAFAAQPPMPQAVPTQVQPLPQELPAVPTPAELPRQLVPGGAGALQR